ncbi:MAG TPA: hypothetical protein VHW43_09640 [Puia sp.]|nr:hypothetical protein [Puia sp.]
MSLFFFKKTPKEIVNLVKANNVAATIYTNILDNYMAFLETLSPGAKLDIISKLTQSLKMEIKPKENLFNRAFGAWEGSESAEEIAKSIRDSRNFTRQIEGL